jgi:hypothetical protein
MDSVVLEAERDVVGDSPANLVVAGCEERATH